MLTTLFLFILSILTACSGTKNVDEYYISNEAFFTGIKGVSVNFQRDSPPEKVLEDSLFEVVLDAKNEGAYYSNGFVTLIYEEDFVCIVDDSGECVQYDVNQVMGLNVRGSIKEKQDGIIAIYKKLDDINSGNDIGDMNALQAEALRLREEIKSLKKSIPLTNPFKTRWIGIEGKSFFTPDGESDLIVYDLKAKKLPSLKTKHETQIIASTCHEYATSFTDEVCIDTNVNKLKIFEGSCTVEDITSSGQGSPVIIEKIESTMRKETVDYIRPTFNIYVRNAGKGKAINKNKVEEACSSMGLEKRDYNAIFLDNFIISNAAYVYSFNGYDPATGKEKEKSNDGDTIECYPNPLILRKGEQNYFRCTLKKNIFADAFRTDQASYATPIQIDLSYGYQFSETKTVEIEKNVLY